MTTNRLPARPTRRIARLRPHPLAAALAVALAAPAALAQTLPGGLQVVAGQASVQTNGAQMTVTNSANAILNWRSFSIGAGAGVRFQQPDAASRVLNRVTGNDPSSILGSLSSNGQVWLLNPNGVLFGAGARIDVAGLVASTLNVSDADFLAGRQRFSLMPGASEDARLVNQGEIRTASGGRVAMLAGPGGVENDGLIEASGGQVLLAAGREIELVDTQAPNLALRVAAPAGEALNLGRVIAAGGRVDVQAAIVNQQGVVRADALASGPGGTVSLQASQALTLAAGSSTSATGASGGTVALDAGAGGTALVSGRVDASGSAGRGGTVTLLGRNVGVLDGGALDASGRDGGGRVAVGGGVQGRDTTLRNAEAAFIAPGATLSADATGANHNGQVVVWSDAATRAYGRLSARGGAEGGDGGLVETSGGWLDARPAGIDVRAPRGLAGTWLLDPNDITISDSVSDTDVTGNPNFTTLNDNALISTATIVLALNNGNNVSITTGAVGTNTQAGDITMTSSSINAAPNVPVSLTLNATRNITLTLATISTSGAALSVNLNAAQGGTSGGVSISNTSIQTAGGNVSIGGNAVATGLHGSATFSAAVAVDANATAGVLFDSSTIDAAGGAVTVRGATAQNASGFSAGVAVLNNTRISGADITLQGWSDGGLTRAGVLVSDSEIDATHTLTLTGTALAGTNPGVPISPTQPGLLAGVMIDDALLRVLPPSPDGTARLRLDGTATISGAASSGTPVNGFGVYVQRVSSGDLLASGGGSLEVLGQIGSADGGYAVGLIGADDYGGTLLDGSAAASVLVRGTGAGRVALTGAEMLAPDGGTLRIESGGDIDLLDGSGNFGAIASRIIGSSASVTLQAAGSITMSGQSRLGFVESPTAIELTAQTGTLTMADSARIDTDATVRLFAPTVRLQDSASIETNASGDAIVVAGVGGANTTAFVHTAASPAFSVTPDGRWLVYAQSPDSSVFDAGSLAHDFRQYNARYGDNPTVLGTGNGLMFSLAPTLALGGTASKVYDGATSILLDGRNLTVTGGLVGGDSAVLAGSVIGDFADAHAGTGKAVTLSSGSVVVTDAAGKPAYGYATGGLTGSVTQRPLSAPSVSAADKVYDGNTTAAVTLAGGPAGLVEGESLNLTADGRFADANAGSGKAVDVTLTLADGTGRASDYTLVGATTSRTASITPRPLTLSPVVADKVYDGGVAAAVSLGAVQGLVDGEQLTLAAGGVFTDPNVGTHDVVVNVSAADGAGGRAANYSVPGSLLASGTVTPARLTYVANSASSLAGGALPTLGGSVTGFVEGENLSLATTGELVWTSPATSASGPGSYAINGGGLAARNYVFVQAADNATALSLLPSTPPAEVTVPLEQSTPETLARALSVLPSLPIIPSPLQDRALDATQALAPPGEGLRFRSVPVEDMSQDALAALLASRDRLKQNLFATALDELARDPKAADVKPCETPQQAEAGTCLITDAQRDALRAAREGRPVAMAPTPPSPPSPPSPPGAALSPTPAPTPAPAPQAAPAPAPAAAPVATAALPSAPLFPSRVTVRNAALPQIQRKLAVLIGTDRYQDTRIPQLDNAVGDARAVAATLDGLGYETAVVADGSKAGILRTLNRLATEAGPSDSIVIYYAGHGAVVPSTGEGYWQPSDADATKASSWISNADIGRAIERLGASQVALISDSCYSGTLVSDARIRATAAALDPAQVLSQRTAVVMSSGGNEPVFDAGKNGHSTFAWNLMRTLQQVPSWQPGGNVFERVRFAVARELPQRPQYGAFGGSVVAGSDYLFEKRQLSR